MPGHLVGITDWRMTRDTEGHREYKLKWRIRTDDTLEGPAVVLQTPGLPIPGTWYVLGTFGGRILFDVDLWAWCRANVTIEPEYSEEPNLWWTLENTFATKPPDHKQQRCQDFPWEDPLLEYQKISGTFTKYTEEQRFDRFAQPIENSAHEQFRGPQVEFDQNRPSVKIEQNVANLELEVFAPMVDTVNAFPLWGLPPRTIKLSNASWEFHWYGSCYSYYKRVFDFDVRFDTFDRDLLDEGTKALRGHWQKDPNLAHYGKYVVDHGLDPANPAAFIRFKDWNGENARVILDGHGRPVDTTDLGTGTGTVTGGNTPGKIHVEYYDESDFLLLRIP